MRRPRPTPQARHTRQLWPSPRSPRTRLRAVLPRHLSVRPALAAGAALVLGAVWALPAAAAAPAEGEILGAGGAGVVEDSYIVVLDEGAPAADSRPGRALAERYGGEIAETYDAALNGFALELPERQARRLAAHPDVAAVHRNRTVTAAATQPDPPSWGLDRIDQRELPLDSGYTYPDSAGEGVTAYVIDTGVRVSHEDFGGRASYGYDAVDGDTSADDGVGHGTHVAATIAGTQYGVAKKADIVAVRVLDDNGAGTEAGVIAGIDWVTKNAVKPAVANLSLGGGASDALDAAVRNSIASGVTYVVAAGNSGTDAATSSPARVTEAVTVGSVTRAGARSGFSNYGESVDLFAPGSSITSATNTGDTATDTASGTSMAAPHVTGAAALLLGDRPSASPAEISGSLVESAVPGTVGDRGDGSPDRLLHIGEQAGGGGQGPAVARFENTADLLIAGGAVTESAIAVSGVGGDAPADLEVEVDIRFAWSESLRIELVAPGGSVHVLKETGPDGVAESTARYTVDASGETADGVWTLRVHDPASAKPGFLNSWALRF
ncbi:S8 family peptidase [Streptomyces albus]|uniref:S8 family peptidase n=1 Tax=Streptomyces albus TaxID=1888 RepID=UPI00099DEF3C|nr:S8 family peptidase [Streptomyces albus]